APRFPHGCSAALASRAATEAEANVRLGIAGYRKARSDEPERARAPREVRSAKEPVCVFFFYCLTPGISRQVNAIVSSNGRHGCGKRGLRSISPPSSLS